MTRMELLPGFWPAVLVALLIGFAAGTLIGSRFIRDAGGRDSSSRGSTQEISAIAVEPTHPFLQDFLLTHLADIRRSQPGFAVEDVPAFARLILRRGLPAGVFLGAPQGQELTMVLDYVTPGYRDSKSGRWLFGEGRATFTDSGFRRLVASPITYEHRTYLETLGFHPEGSRLVREL